MLPDPELQQIVSARVLVVEDEPFIALELEACLLALGCVCVGPMRTVKDGVDAAKAEAIDTAIVDLILHAEMSYPVLEALAERQVPFLIVTGVPRGEIDARWSDRPMLEKPFGRDQIHEVLLGLLERPDSRPS